MVASHRKHDVQHLGGFFVRRPAVGGNVAEAAALLKHRIGADLAAGVLVPPVFGGSVFWAAWATGVTLASGT